MIDVKAKFVSVLLFRIEPEDLPGFAREATLSLERKAPLHQGFVEGIIMMNEQKTEVLIVSQWESRHDWSAAQWDDDLGRTMSDLVQGASSFEIRSYEPISVVHTV
jgi:hypothetical protein